MAKNYLSNLARALIGQPYEALSTNEKHVIDAIAAGEPVAENTNKVFKQHLSFGQKQADSLAKIVGSWGFIIFFIVVLSMWMVLNTIVLSQYNNEFDPYPYILLNLALSTLAAIQAPVIMMSQNRQADKDRLAASNTFEVNLKIELAIQQLHEKIDRILNHANSE